MSAAVLAAAPALAGQAALLAALAHLGWWLGLGRRRPAMWAALWTIVLLKGVLPWAPDVAGSVADVWARLWGASATASALAPAMTAAIGGGAGAAASWLPALVLGGWLAVSGRRLGLALLRQCRQRRQIDALDEAPAWVQARCGELAARLRVPAPRVRVHPAAVTPHLVVGVRSAALVVPQALLDEPAPLALALAHELAHLRRRDALARALLTFAAALWFFLPVRRCVGQPLERSQEQAADALARRALGLSAAAYSRVLVAAALRCQASAPTAALALGSSSSLVERVEALCVRGTQAGAGWRGAALVLAFTVLGLGQARSPSAAGDAGVCEYSAAIAEALREVHPEADRDGDGELARDEACALQEQLRRSAFGGAAPEQVAQAQPPLWQRLCCECELPSAPQVRSEPRSRAAVPEACEQE
jgi:bla regulator protein blaR1